MSFWYATKNSQELPDDVVEKRRSASELKSN